MSSIPLYTLFYKRLQWAPPMWKIKFDRYLCSLLLAEILTQCHRYLSCTSTFKEEGKLKILIPPHPHKPIQGPEILGVGQHALNSLKLASYTLNTCINAIRRIRNAKSYLHTFRWGLMRESSRYLCSCSTDEKLQYELWNIKKKKISHNIDRYLVYLFKIIKVGICYHFYLSQTY